MRVPLIKLQQLAVYTTLLTGGGVATMYYLLQSEFHSFTLYENNQLARVS